MLSVVAGVEVVEGNEEEEEEEGKTKARSLGWNDC